MHDDAADQVDLCSDLTVAADGASFNLGTIANVRVLAYYRRIHRHSLTLHSEVSLKRKKKQRIAIMKTLTPLVMHNHRLKHEQRTTGNQGVTSLESWFNSL